jgi:hypothetical protein
VCSSDLLFAQGFAAAALSAAETTFPVLEAISVEDPRPLVRPAALPDVPVPARRNRAFHVAGVIVSLAFVGIGVVAIVAARPRRPRKDSPR